MIWQNLLHHDPRGADVKLSRGRTDDPLQRQHRLISSVFCLLLWKTQPSFLNAYSIPFRCLFQFIEAKSFSKASPMRKSTGPLKLIMHGSNNTFNQFTFLMSFTSLWRNFGSVLFPIFYLISHTGGFQALAAFFRPCHSISIGDHSHLQRSHLNCFSPTIFFYMHE